MLAVVSQLANGVQRDLIELSKKVGKVIKHGLDGYQNNVLSVRATEMLYNGLSQTSSLCTHSSRGSYCDSQPWRRSRKRTSSGFPSPQACSDVPAGNRASRPTEDEVTEGRLLASSSLAMFPPLCYVVLDITGCTESSASSVRDLKGNTASGYDFQNKTE